MLTGRRCRALVPLPSDRCPSCGAGVTLERWEQPALIRHGGHGGSERHTVRQCAAGCGWSLVAEIATVRPPREALCPDRAPVRTTTAQRGRKRP